MDPYATHLQVLTAIGQTLPIRRVLECGAGRYSTPLFLDRLVFPVLQRLDSLESDWVWLTRSKETVRDARAWFTYTGPRMETFIQEVDLDGYDLIFVDSGAVIAERLPVLRTIVEGRPAGVVVVHDYEQPAYQAVVEGQFEHRVIDRALSPWTAVLWNGERPVLERLAV